MLRKVEKEQLKVPANVDYLGDLRDFVTQVGKKHRFSDKVINAFKLAVDEAATNIIRHAYREREGLITLRTIVRKGSLTLCIIDQGTYFDPQRVKDPDLNRYINIGKKGGLGIFIMRKLMDEIDYRRTEEGNELRITKHRDKNESKKLVSKVSAIPLSIKVNFFLRSILIATCFIGLGYLYYFIKADDIVLTNFIAAERAMTSRIVHRVSSAPIEESTFLEDIIHPIYQDYENRVVRMAIEDSTGLVVWSSDESEFDLPFVRPDRAEELDEGIYKYGLNGSNVFEFENVIVTRPGAVFGKVHIIISAERAESEIRHVRLNYLKFALLILGVTCLGVAILIYLVMNPLRKLSSWIKDLGHGEIDDEIDIDASSEIGEIAQAFSEITHKFRESQRNLVDQERIQREMQVAQDIQQTLLPMEFPEVEGYEIASYYEAAKEVGGDYYDFVEVDKDTLGIAIADVSGKGVPGSLVMTMIRTALRTEARGVKDAAEVLARVNSFVSNDIKKGMFVTVFYLIIDSKRRRLNYASAGHNPMILYRTSSKKTYYLNPKGFPIGIQLPEKDLFRKSIDSETIQLAKDDILLVYTDGITEAMNPTRMLFGEERLLQVLREYGHLPADEFVEKLKTAIYSFTEGYPQYDDISLVAIKEQSTREADELRRAKEAHSLISEGMSIRDACDTVNLTTYAYYNKYKRVFEERGTDAFEIDEEVSVEAKYFSIEDKTKIFDIIANHPEYGASRISDELNTEKYNFTQISESKIYEELVRNRLNTRQLREGYVARGKKSKRRLKPPGTPMLTLDGQVVIDRADDVDYTLEPIAETGEEKAPEPTFLSAPEGEPAIDSAESQESHEFQDENAGREAQPELEADSLLGDSIDELLSKEKEEEVAYDKIPSDFVKETDLEDVEQSDMDTSAEEMLLDSSLLEAEAEAKEFDVDNLDSNYHESNQLDDFSFESLFEENAFPGEEDFEEENIDDGSGPPTDSGIPKYEATRSKNENGQSGVRSDQDKDEDYLASSVDGLLSESGDASRRIGEESSQKGPNIEQTDGPTGEGPSEERHSFADLIQAIDDEIVYVTDNLDLKKENRRKEKRADPELNMHQTESKPAPAVAATAEKPSRQERSEPRRRSPEALDDREKQLIKGIRHYKNQNYQQAILEFNKVIDRYPEYKEAHSILGNAYFRNKMYDEAIMAYERVKGLDANDITAYENMGVIYANRGEYELAVSEWKAVLELSPDRMDIEDRIKKALLMI